MPQQIDRRRLISASVTAAAVPAAALASGCFDGERSLATLTDLSRFGSPDGGTFADGVSRTANLNADIAARSNAVGLIRVAISVTEFGAKGDGVTNNNAAFAAARAYLATADPCPALVFPAGIYSYSVSPDWGVQWIRMVAEGEVRFRYTGTGNAFIVTDDQRAQMMGLSFFSEEAPLIIEAPSTAQNGVLWRSVHHSVGCFVIRGCGANFSGLRIEFAVCSTFPTFRCSYNENANGTQNWYLGAKPKYGVFLTQRDRGEAASYCMFNNPVIEGVETGIYAEYALGCNFIGGTSEGNTSCGIEILSTSSLNKCIAVDFESNGGNDIVCRGFGNAFIDCDTGFPTGSVVFIGASAVANRLEGGTHQNIAYISGAAKNTVRDLTYNRGDATGTGTITGGEAQAIYNIYNSRTDTRHNQVPYFTNVTVGSSPWRFTNTAAQSVNLVISGGNVFSILVGNGAGAFNGGTQGHFSIVPGGTAVVTYSKRPAATVFSQ